MVFIFELLMQDKRFHNRLRRKQTIVDQSIHTNKRVWLSTFRNLEKQTAANTKRAIKFP